MKMTFMALLLTLTTGLYAHEGGHGELNEGGKFGGVTSPMVDFTQAGLGDKATTLYKAELVRAENGTLSLYIFDKDMKLMPLDHFADGIEAKLEVKKKGKFTYFGTFKFIKNKNHFKGQLPKIEYKPFNIDIFPMHKSQKLFVGFSNLD